MPQIIKIKQMKCVSGPLNLTAGDFSKCLLPGRLKIVFNALLKNKKTYLLTTKYCSSKNLELRTAVLVCVSIWASRFPSGNGTKC